MNLVVLTGRVGKDPDVYKFENGGAKSSFSLATSESYKDKDGEWKEVTDWHNIVLYRETKIKKGDFVELTGKLKTRSYEKDGEKKYITEVVANSLKLLSRKKEGQEQKQSKPKPQPQVQDDPIDDLPF